jgi:Glycosyltransferase family 10 (fucosyltransferase) C-term/Fucosyltransferase, N-terminal
MKKYTILFYNLMWDQPIDFNQIGLPADFLFTTDHSYLETADAIIFHMPSLAFRGKLEKKNSQLWIFWSMECEEHYPALTNPGLLALFDIYMTYKSDADIWVPYIHPEYKDKLRQKPATKTNFITAFISSPFNKSKREERLREIMSFVKVESYGKLFHNTKIVDDAGVQTKLDTVSKYKFTIAFENAIARDYVTEKFYDPLIAGSVPIYLGAPNIDEFAPAKKCYIDVNSFPSTKELVDYLMLLNNDDSLYRQYLAWKDTPFQQRFLQKLEAVQRHPFLRLCELIKASDPINAAPLL